MLDQSTLREILHYDPETGIFTWLKSPTKSVKFGAIAGTKTIQGYVRIKINNQRYFAHRLAWLYTYGIFPSKNIDHINGNPSDNRICNLREANAAENGQNQLLAKGFTWNKVVKKWQVEIKVDKKPTYVGLYNTLIDARAAYLRKKRELHTFSPIAGR